MLRLTALATLLLSCAPAAPSTAIEQLELSVTGAEGPYQPVALGFTGVPLDLESTFLRLQLPALGCDDPVLALRHCRQLVAAQVGDRPVPVNPDYCFWLPLRRDDAGSTVRLQFHGPLTQLWGMHVGCWSTALGAGLRQDMLEFTIGALSMLVGLFTLLGYLLRRSELALAALGAFCLSVGIVNVEQSLQFAQLFPLPLGIADGVRRICLFVTPICFAVFLREAVTPHFQRISKWLLRWTLGLLVLVIALAVTGLYPLASIARWAHVNTLVLGIAAAVLIVGAAVKRVDDARVLATGFLLMFIPSTIDLLSGVGIRVVQLPFNVAPIGMASFAVAGFVMVQNKFLRQRSQLKSRVAELEQRRREVETLNDELRHQVEQRSRELQALVALGPAIDSAGRSQFHEGDKVAGRYEVKKRLGAGAMGVVYEVVRLTDQARLALKVMSGNMTGADAARFAREAELAARLKHRNLVSVVDVGHIGPGVLFLVMELVEGTTLEKLRSEFGHATWALRSLQQMADGLAAMHAAGVVHRDLKPANVLVSFEGAEVLTRIADFGLARPTLESDHAPLVAREMISGGELDETRRPDNALTQAGALMGTPQYMPPEVVAREPASFPSDVFSFGLMAFELLSGKYPLKAPPYVNEGRVERLEVALPVSGALAELLERTLQSTPAQRPTAAELLVALSAHVTLR